MLVTGAGPIGILSAMYAAAVGAGAVIMAEPNPNRAALAASLDIGEVLDPTAPGFSERLLDLTAGIGVDLTVECSGTSPGLATAMLLDPTGGCGGPDGPAHQARASSTPWRSRRRTCRSTGAGATGSPTGRAMIRLVAAGKYPVAKAVTAQIDLPDVVTRGFDVLVDPQGDQLKVLVRSGRRLRRDTCAPSTTRAWSSATSTGRSGSTTTCSACPSPTSRPRGSTGRS